MIKRIIQTFIVLSVLNNVLVIYYWRDTQYDPSNIDFLLYFGILPLLICLLLLTSYFIYKAVNPINKDSKNKRIGLINLFKHNSKN